MRYLPGSRTTGSGDADAPDMLVLSVMEEITRRGPVTGHDLQRRLQARGPDVRRALDVLHARNWVTRRPGDRAFEVTDSFGTMAWGAQTGGTPRQALVRVMTAIRQKGPFHVDIGRFTAPGVFRIVETTRRINILDDALSLVDDDIAVACQLELPAPRLRAHLDAYARTAERAEKSMIAVGEHQFHLRSLRGDGRVWASDGNAVSVPCLTSLGFEGGICVSLRRQSPADQKRLTEIADHLHRTTDPSAPFI